MSWLKIPIGSFLWLAVALDLTIQGTKTHRNSIEITVGGRLWQYPRQPFAAYRYQYSQKLLLLHLLVLAVIGIWSMLAVVVLIQYILLHGSLRIEQQRL